MRPDELQEGEEDLSLSVRVRVCVGKGVKKEEVKDSEYIPTGMRLTDNPM